MTPDPQKPDDDELQPVLRRLDEEFGQKPEREPEPIYGEARPIPQQSHQLRLPLSRPRAVWVLLALNIAIFIIPTVLQLVGVQIDGIPINDYVLGSGVLYGPFVKVYGHYYRFLTSMFLHYGLLHIAFNSYSLYIFGIQVEQIYGTLRFLAVYLISGLCGGAAYYALSTGAGAGASGAIFGLVGALAAFFYLSRKLFHDNGRQRLGSLITLVAINLGYGYSTPNIGTTAHLGGLAGGALLGWLLAPRFAVDERIYPPQVVRNPLAWGWVGTIGFLVLLVLMVIVINPPIQ